MSIRCLAWVENIDIPFIWYRLMYCHLAVASTAATRFHLTALMRRSQAFIFLVFTSCCDRLSLDCLRRVCQFISICKRSTMARGKNWSMSVLFAHVSGHASIPVPVPDMINHMLPLIAVRTKWCYYFGVQTQLTTDLDESSFSLSD